MKRILLAVGIVFLLIGIGVIVQQKIHEPYYREQLFEETATETYYRDEPLKKIILIPENENVHIYVESHWSKYGALPITLSVYTLNDYEGNRTHPLLNGSTASGSFFGSFTTTETTQYIFLLYAVYARYEVYTESIWSPIFMYTIGFCLMLIGSVILLFLGIKSKKIR